MLMHETTITRFDHSLRNYYQTNERIKLVSCYVCIMICVYYITHVRLKLFRITHKCATCVQ